MPAVSIRVAIAPPWTTSPIVALAGSKGRRSSARSSPSSTSSRPSLPGNGEEGRNRSITLRRGGRVGGGLQAARVPSGLTFRFGGMRGSLPRRGQPRRLPRRYGSRGRVARGRAARPQAESSSAFAASTAASSIWPSRSSVAVLWSNCLRFSFPALTAATQVGSARCLPPASRPARRAGSSPSLANDLAAALRGGPLDLALGAGPGGERLPVDLDLIGPGAVAPHRQLEPLRQADGRARAELDRDLAPDPGLVGLGAGEADLEHEVVGALADVQRPELVVDDLLVLGGAPALDHRHGIRLEHERGPVALGRAAARQAASERSRSPIGSTYPATSRA